MRISKYGPETCPGFEAKNREVFLNAIEKHESLAAKHEIKIIGAWVDYLGHTVYSVYNNAQHGRPVGLLEETRDDGCRVLPD